MNRTEFLQFRCIVAAVRFIFCLLLFSMATLLGEAGTVAPKIRHPTRVEIAALQIALDNEGFAPGVIDGRSGPKLETALKYAGRTLEVSPPSEAWCLWKIPADITNDVAVIPESWLERSKLERMTHESIREKIAEHFHLSEDFLERLNPKVKDWTALKEGDSLRVPFLMPRRLPLADHLRVVLSEKIILALDAQDHPLASFPCSIAAKKAKRPVGQLQVSTLAPDPDYLFDPKLFSEVPEAATLKSKLMISPGPNNPVGEMWIGLNRVGYGIHGTPHPEDIGKTESHGCFRLANWDARRLAGMLRLGTPVLVEE